MLYTHRTILTTLYTLLITLYPRSVTPCSIRITPYIMLALFALGIKPSVALSLSPHEQRRLQHLAHSQQLGYNGRHHAHALTPVGGEGSMGGDDVLTDGALVEYGQQRSVIKSGWLHKKGFVNQVRCTVHAVHRTNMAL